MFRFDETDSRFLVTYTGPDHAELSDYRELIRRLHGRLAGGPRFGVLIVYEPQTEEQHDHEHTAEEQESYTRLLNDLRRDYRALLNQRCFGYASVLAPVYQPPAGDAAAWAHAEAETDRFARYTLGVPGSTFATETAAKAWLTAQAQLPPIALESAGEHTPGNHWRVGLFYGSTTGVTEYVAEEIAQAWQAAGLEPIEAMNIGNVTHLTELLAFDYLILGISTWNIGQLQDDWDLRFDQLDDVDFGSKHVALFGIGDQVNYAENFQDAMGMLAAKLRERGALLAGQWSREGYSFAASLALQNDRLAGLAIDEINQPDQTSERISRWVAQVIDEWQLQPLAVQLVE